MSDDLLNSLTADLKPVSRWYVERRLLIGITVGMVISVILVFLTLGPRKDLAIAVTTSMFWIKQFYTFAFALAAGFLAERLARPAATARQRTKWVFFPLLALAALAILELTSAPQSERMLLVMGNSARVCSPLILCYALPPLLGLIWAMRGLAPTHLRQAGAAIGLAAGGAGAFVYSLHCPESTAAFLAIWYSIGIFAVAGLGWLVGPRLLRFT
jgi:hypothetical protein